MYNKYKSFDLKTFKKEKERFKMKMEDILNAIRELASSQGFYGRLLRDLTELKENDLESYNSIKEELESQNFQNAVDLVMYFEC